MTLCLDNVTNLEELQNLVARYSDCVSGAHPSSVYMNANFRLTSTKLEDGSEVFDILVSAGA